MFIEKHNQFMGFGENGAQTGAEVISYAQTGVSVASGITTGIAAISGVSASQAVVGIGVGGAVLGVSTLALGVVGLVLVVISVIYNLIMGSQAKQKMKRKLRRARMEAIRNIGIDLIKQVYGMAIPGWLLEYEAEIGEYYQLGSSYYSWSQLQEETVEYESGRHFIAIFLRDRGLDPTRFLGGINVKEDEELKIMEMWVALPERILISKEALHFLGYEMSVVDNLENDFHIRLFDMIKAMGRVKTEEQAIRVKMDIENWLISKSLDPKIFFQKGADHAGVPSVPSPVNSSQTISPEPLLLPGELEERSAIGQNQNISPIVLIGIVIGAALMLSQKRKVR